MSNDAELPGTGSSQDRPKPEATNPNTEPENTERPPTAPRSKPSLEDHPDDREPEPES